MWIAGGKIILDFFNNESIDKKRAMLAQLSKETHRQFNASILEVDDFEELERCVLGLALAASNEKNARTSLKKVLDYIDSHAEARVVTEDTDVFAYD